MLSSRHGWPLWLRGSLRLMGLLLVLSVVSVFVVLRSAHARAGESLLLLGSQLSRIVGSQQATPAGRLVINGMGLEHQSFTTPREVNIVLDQVSDYCANHGGFSLPELARVPSVASAKRGLLDGVLRYDTGNVGTLVCLDTNGKLGAAELVTRLQRFAQTGDLASIGRLRYVFARREKSVTSVLVFWSNETAPLLKLFPKTGDAPGTDLPEIPRPSEATRLLAAAEDGQPYSLRIYRLPKGSAATVAHWYRIQLNSQGWRVEAGGREMLIARLGSRTIVIHLAETAGGTALSVAALS